MKSKVLFSPVGGTDPISNFRDGPLLHILRVYKPDVVYLYLSKEMCDFQNKDDRYIYCIEKLGKHLNHEFQVHEIMKPELVNVQNFDYFLNEFRVIISQVALKHKGFNLYLNVSSGTPAMKSSLQLMAVLSEFKITPIQVSTPRKKINVHEEDREDYDVESYWILNEDNMPEFENRCIESEGQNLLATIKIEIIKKHIDAYDYVAALNVAEDMEDYFNEDLFKLLVAANYRLQLNFSGIDKVLNGLDYDILPIKEHERKIVLEYLLYLKIKLVKEEYADFIRGTTPIIAELFEMVLKKQCNIVVDDYCSKRKNKNNTLIKKWDRRKLENNQDILYVLDNHFVGGIKEAPVASYHMAIIIDTFCTNEKIKETVRDLRDAEQIVRNLAAHETVSVTDEWIEKKTGFNSEQLINKLKYLAQMSGVNITKDLWNSYDLMNKLIIDILNN